MVKPYPRRVTMQGKVGHIHKWERDQIIAASFSPKSSLGFRPPHQTIFYLSILPPLRAAILFLQPLCWNPSFIFTMSFPAQPLPHTQKPKITQFQGFQSSAIHIFSALNNLQSTCEFSNPSVKTTPVWELVRIPCLVHLVQPVVGTPFGATSCGNTGTISLVIRQK